MAHGGKREGAGRQKGTVNRITQEYRDIIAKSNPVQFLIDAFQNGYIEGVVHPLQEESDAENRYLTLTLKERCDIAKSLTDKILPNLKAIEHTGEDGGDINHSISVTFVASSKDD